MSAGRALVGSGPGLGLQPSSAHGSDSAFIFLITKKNSRGNSSLQVCSERLGGGDVLGLGPIELIMGGEGELHCELHGETSKKQVEEHRAKGGKRRRNWL